MKMEEDTTRRMALGTWEAFIEMGKACAIWDAIGTAKFHIKDNTQVHDDKEKMEVPGAGEGYQLKCIEF